MVDAYRKQCRGTVLKYRFLRTPCYSVYLLTAERSALEALTAKNEEQASANILHVAVHFYTKSFHSF